MSLKVDVEPHLKDLTTNQIIQLLEDGGPFPIGYPIKDALCLVSPSNMHCNGVSRGEGVRADSPELVSQKSQPETVEVSQFGGLLHGDEGHKGSKTLVEPEVVPPLHGDEVAEPHVRQLVQVSYGEAEALLQGDGLAPVEVGLVVGDTAHVLHGS